MPEIHKHMAEWSVKTIQDLKIVFSQKKNIKETQAKVKMELKKFKTQLGDSGESLISRMD